MIAQQQPIWPAPALLAPEPRALDATIRPPIAPLADADERPQHRHPFDATSTISCRSSVAASESTQSAVQRNKPAIPTPTKTSGHTLSNRDFRFACPRWHLYRVYPGFPTLFWGLSVFFVGDLMGKALWKLVENAARFPKARWARSVRPRRRQLPQGPSVWAKMAPREGGHASCRAGPPRPRTAVDR